MQERLLNLVKKTIALDANKTFNAIIRDRGFQEFVLFLNKSQLFKGEDSLGVKLGTIGGGYSFVTEFLNAGKSFNFAGESETKKAGDSPILFDTGEYYDSYKFIPGNGFFIIDSNPQKEDNNLEESYGSNLEGLQQENVQKIIAIFRTKFIEEVRRKLLS